MKPSHGLEELCCSTPNVLPIRQAASGVNQQYINQKHRILQSGVGEKRRSVARFLDRPSTYCRELGVDKVRLQVGVPWKVHALNCAATRSPHIFRFPLFGSVSCLCPSATWRKTFTISSQGFNICIKFRFSLCNSFSPGLLFFTP